MSVFKPFLAQDIIITPFTVNKSFQFTGRNALTSSNVGIDIFIAKNITSSFNLSSSITGEFTTGSYQQLLYSSVEKLYYSNFISSSKGDEATLYINNNGVEVQANNNQPRYENYLQSTLVPQRYFPTASNKEIGIISIPTTLYGDQIKPKSFVLNSPSGSLLDDGEGNIFYFTSSYIDHGYVDFAYFTPISNGTVGNIIYSHGIVTLTLEDYAYNIGSFYGTSSYGSGIYGNPSLNILSTFASSSNITMSFQSTYTIYETQYKCTIRENEFNFSLNPTLLSGSTDEVIYNFATGSSFAPYITTVGLYNENQELLMVAKLSQPLPSSPTTDMNVIINIDR